MGLRSLGKVCADQRGVHDVIAPNLPLMIKLGGASLKAPECAQRICQEIARIHAEGMPVIVVHGGGPSINEELTLRGITWEFHDGLRVTTPAMMDVIEMVLCGRVNSGIVRMLGANGIQALGLSGADSQLLLCERTAPELGEVGEILSVNASMVHACLGYGSKKRILPVIAPVGVDAGGKALNINADWAASRIAVALGVREIVFVTDQDGILDSSGMLIHQADLSDLDRLIGRKTVTGGMLTKARAIQHALRNGVKSVHIVNGTRAGALSNQILSRSQEGTTCTAKILERSQACSSSTLTI